MAFFGLAPEFALAVFEPADVPTGLPVAIPAAGRGAGLGADAGLALELGLAGLAAAGSVPMNVASSEAAVFSGTNVAPMAFAFESFELGLLEAGSPIAVSSSSLGEALADCGVLMKQPFR